MNANQNLDIARQLLEALGSDQDPDAIAAMFHDEAIIEFPGDVGALPWIGRKVGRGAIVDFFIASKTVIAREEFEVYDILASDDRSTIVGALTTRVVTTGRRVHSFFAIVLKVDEGIITEFLMLEDSFAVSRAARA